ncbi:hypothetical protein M9H77_07204 [Catharanthus roseus]|uniref:Uncharacterized protein n=1 Tax=Catharanthus roseus TaxID=4058 RepID=A0ACC0BUG2_CATRO|nr:hypothetical protein M9H77_07204 [Catharanthus roseus]
MAPKKYVASFSKPKWARAVGTSPDPDIPPYPEHLYQVAREWVAEKASLKIIVEKSFDDSVIEHFDLQNFFKGLEFYANMTYKTNKDLQTIISTIKGVRIILDRKRLASILGIPGTKNLLTNHPQGQFPKSFSSCSCLFLWAQTRSKGGCFREVIKYFYNCGYLLDEENQVWVPHSKEDRLQECNAAGFRSIKKTTHTGLGASSSQQVEGDGEANESNNPSYVEEDKADAQNTILIDAVQT